MNVCCNYGQYYGAEGYSQLAGGQALGGYDSGCSEEGSGTGRGCDDFGDEGFGRAPVQNNRLVTDFFQTRTSSRVPAARLKRQKEKSIQKEILNQEDKGMQVVIFAGKGRGVLAAQTFQKDDFVVEYAGELLASDIAKIREKCYELVTGVGCYMYYFKFKNKQFCIDATEESGRLGRLINHSKTNGNLYPKVVNVDGEPHLALMAARRILAGEELLYDYGDRRRRSVAAHPWLAV